MYSRAFTPHVVLLFYFTSYKHMFKGMNKWDNPEQTTDLWWMTSSTDTGGQSQATVLYWDSSTQNYIPYFLGYKTEFFPS